MTETLTAGLIALFITFPVALGCRVLLMGTETGGSRRRATSICMLGIILALAALVLSILSPLNSALAEFIALMALLFTGTFCVTIWKLFSNTSENELKKLISKDL